MNEAQPRSIEVKVERLIAASPQEVFDAWLNPKTPGTIWQAAKKLILDAKPDGLFFWCMEGKDTPHYGRFITLNRGKKIEHTWVSPNTLGRESIVTITFEKQGAETLMTLVHTDLPDAEFGRRHEYGWNHFLGLFAETYAHAGRS